MFLVILSLLAVAYLILMILFAVGAWRSSYPSDRASRPSVSIIIAARNEEENIGRCLRSMSSLTYPREKLEILVVDDRSTDSTAEIVRTFAAESDTIRVVTAHPPTDHLRGKANAVSQGMDAARGDIILFTDADCEVQPRWVEETVKYYTGRRVGIVAGFTELAARREFDKMQALDWFLLFSLAAAGIKLRHPLTAVGNNLSVSRTAYDVIGGYRSIPFSVTEDYALFHAVTSERKFEARFPLDPATLVLSRPCKTLGQLYQQKKRWFSGGRDMGAGNLAFFSVIYLYKLLLIVGLPVMVASGTWFPWVAKLVADFVVLLPTLKTFRRWNLLTAFPLLEIYLTLYVILYPPIVLAGSAVTWKDRSFRRRPF